MPHSTRARVCKLATRPAIGRQTSTLLRHWSFSIRDTSGQSLEVHMGKRDATPCGPGNGLEFWIAPHPGSPIGNSGIPK